MLGTLLALLASGTRLRIAEVIGLGALETWRPAVPGQRKLRRGVALDVAYSYLVPVIIYPAVYGTIRLLGRAPDVRGPFGQLGYAAQVVLAVVVGDFVAYWKHRFLHTRLLWPFHAAHHSSVEVDWWSNERVHPVESAINAILQAGTLVLQTGTNHSGDFSVSAGATLRFEGGHTFESTSDTSKVKWWLTVPNGPRRTVGLTYTASVTCPRMRRQSTRSTW